MIAVWGLTTESIGAPSTGMSNWNASIVQAVETSSGLRVRREGTTAMSSNVYARRARLARPSSMSMLTRPAYPWPLPRSISASPLPDHAGLVPHRHVGLEHPPVGAEHQEAVERARQPAVVRDREHGALE